MAQPTRESNRPGLVRIDHGAIPVNDAGRAYRFYHELLGAELHHIGHLTNRPFKDGQGPMIFLEIAGHKGWALALEYEDLPAPEGTFDCPCWAFSVSEEAFKRALEVLKQQGISHTIVEGRPSGPVARSIFFRDTEANSVEVCLRK